MLAHDATAPTVFGKRRNRHFIWSKTVTITGELFIGGKRVRGTGGPLHARNASTGEILPGEFSTASIPELELAVKHADEAFFAFREIDLQRRARLLDAIAENILKLGDELVTRCMAETGLPQGRIEGERGRTVGQLRMFADVVRQKSFLNVRIETAQPDRKPAPRPDLRLRNVPLGPVAVFGASNFPLAFSVAGGDTASALAAGCPVIVKAHSAHLGTSELVGQAVQNAIAELGLPPGLFALLSGSGQVVGEALVAHEKIRAVGFTGSRRGGTALMKIAAAKRQPSPVFAEMSSINPVLLFPRALETNGESIGGAFASALTLGCGQFCTNPGLVIAIKGAALERFIASAAASIAQFPPTPMLTSSILESYREGGEALASQKGVTRVSASGSVEAGRASAQLFRTTAKSFLSNPALHAEVFGPTSLIVEATDWSEVETVIASLEGQLTVALHIEGEDQELAAKMLPQLECLAGRILVNGFGTGVEVGAAMVHGGPYPATSDGRSTSVGSLAIERFLRPVCYQDLPATLLPPELR